MTTRAVACLDQAMDIEYRRLPDVVNLEGVRAEFGSLLSRYQQLADAIATLQTGPPQDLANRVVRAADRWRSLDSDDTAACQAAARILHTLGARDLAWEYLTTPLAERPSDAPAWQTIGQTLRQQGSYELADRAFCLAFEAAPTNAQILWDQAQMLEQCGKLDEARHLYRRLAEGEWAAQFNSIQTQARKFLDPG